MKLFALFLCLLGSLAAGATEPLPDLPRPHADRLNLVLDGTELGVRELDAFSTRLALQNPCHCMHENGNTVILRGMAYHDWSQYAYSTGASAAYLYVSHRLWKAGTIHHRRILHLAARALLVTDIVLDARDDLRNFHNAAWRQP